MTPTQPRTVADSMVRAGKALLAERYGPKNAASIVAAIEEEAMKIGQEELPSFIAGYKAGKAAGEEAVSEYRDALRGTRRFEMNIDGSPCWCEEEPPSYAPHEKWCDQARSLLDRSGVTE